MEPGKFDTWFGSGGSAPFPVDNEMLDAEDPTVDKDGASAATGRAKNQPIPPKFVHPVAAIARMTGQPTPMTEAHEIETSSESDEFGTEEEDEDIDFVDQQVDAVLMGAAGGNARKKKKHQVKTGMACFGCALSIAGTKGSSDASISNSAIGNLERLFRELCPTTDRVTLAHLLHSLYLATIYEPLMREWKPPEPKPVRWHKRDIYTHFWHHTKDPEVYLLNQLDEYEQLSKLLYLSCVAETESGSGVVPLEKTIMAKLRVDGHIKALRKERLEEHNFRQGEDAIDLSKAGNFFAPFRAFKRG